MKRLWYLLALCLGLFLISYNLWFFVLREATGATWREVLLQGGMVVDGTGKKMFMADVLIRDGKIAVVGKGIKAAPGARVVDVGGALLLPGFVQILDRPLPTEEMQEALTGSGVTTIACTTDGTGFRRQGEYPGRAGRILNYGMLLGAGDLRESENPRELVQECLAEGFLGLDLDMDNPRDALINFDDIVPLLDGILPRPLLVLHLTEDLCLDHKSLLAALESISPTGSKGSFTLYLRDFRLEKDLSGEAMTEIRGGLARTGAKGDFNPFVLRGEPRYTLAGAVDRFPPDALYLAETPPSLRYLQGKSLGEAARDEGATVPELAARLREQSGGEGSLLVEVVETGGEKAFSTAPFFCWQAPPGFFHGGEQDVPRYLGLLEEERLPGSLEERVRRLTSLPAEMLGIESRGIITPRAYADLLVVRRNREGFSLESVFVNGRPVLFKGKRTGFRPGIMIFRGQAGIPPSGENS